MNNQTQTRVATSTTKMVMYALLTAIVIILQMLGSFIHLGPFSVSLVLVPLVIGAALCGTTAGAWLGLVFGIVVLITDSAAFMTVSVPGTVLTVLVKGVAAGLGAGAVYAALHQKNKTLAVIAAAAVCPVINTGLFLIGCRLFFMEQLAVWAGELGFASLGDYIIFGLVGGNFIFELVINLVLSPTIVRLIQYRTRK